MFDHDEDDDYLDGDDAEDDDGWDEEDSEELPDDDEETTVDCRYCGRAVYDDAVSCPHCGNYFTAEDEPHARKPWWVIAGAMVCLYVVFRWIAG